MKKFTQRIESPAHQRWMNAIVLQFKDYEYTRRELDAMGVGLHTIGAARLNRKLLQHDIPTLGQLFKWKLRGVLALPGVGEISAIIISHCLDAAGYNVFEWIGAKGRSYKGAMANAKAKAKSRIPGRTARARRS